MSTHVGLWIDHRNAIVVALREGKESSHVITSLVEKQLRRTGDEPMQGTYEPQLVPADDRRQNTLTGHLNNYYDAVIADIRSAESILLFGPGEAKHELNQRLAAQQLGDHVVGIETADKMTDRQIVAKVRDYFAA
jgi:hypothetical protein